MSRYATRCEMCAGSGWEYPEDDDICPHCRGTGREMQWPHPYVEIVKPSGAISVSGTDPEGYRVALTFYGYTRAEAVAAWREQAPTYWRDLEAQEKRYRQAPETDAPRDTVADVLNRHGVPHAVGSDGLRVTAQDSAEHGRT